MDPAAAARPAVSPGDLGRAASTPDGRFHLVSFLTTPLLRDSRNESVVFDRLAAEGEKDHAHIPGGTDQAAAEPKANGRRVAGLGTRVGAKDP